MKRLYLFSQRSPWVSPLPAGDGEDAGDKADGVCPQLDSSPPSMLSCPLQRRPEAIPLLLLVTEGREEQIPINKVLGAFPYRGGSARC